MTDKELLELAAKAAGLTLANQKDDEVQLEQYCKKAHKLENGEFWNPLTDDGDALRLAVKLGFPLEFDPVHTCDRDEWVTDPYAATRRAIVRAAAEIGKNLG